jgi:hypothetical protein
MAGCDSLDASLHCSHIHHQKELPLTTLSLLIYWSEYIKGKWIFMLPDDR